MALSSSSSAPAVAMTLVYTEVRAEVKYSDADSSLSRVAALLSQAGMRRPLEIVVSSDRSAGSIGKLGVKFSGVIDFKINVMLGTLAFLLFLNALFTRRWKTLAVDPVPIRATWRSSARSPKE